MTADSDKARRRIRLRAAADTLAETVTALRPTTAMTTKDT